MGFTMVLQPTNMVMTWGWCLSPTDSALNTTRCTIDAGHIEEFQNPQRPKFDDLHWWTWGCNKATTGFFMVFHQLKSALLSCLLNLEERGVCNQQKHVDLTNKYNNFGSKRQQKLRFKQQYVWDFTNTIWGWSSKKREWFYVGNIALCIFKKKSGLYEVHRSTTSHIIWQVVVQRTDIPQPVACWI